MDHIERHLASAAIDKKYDSSIQAAINIGKTLLNRYYSLTDHSELYHIAMGKFLYVYFNNSILIYTMHTFLVLHPSHKVDYFKMADWTDEWHETAAGIVRAEFECVYAGIDSEDSDDSLPVRVFLFFSLFLFTCCFRKQVR